MTSTNLQRDASFAPIQGNDAMLASKAVTYVAGTTGTVDAHTLFTVTGDVLIRIFATCSVNLDSDGVATIEVGIAGNTAALLAQTTATGIDAGEVWIDNAPATIEALPATQIVTNGTDIIATIGTAAIKAGALTFYCLWRPLSSGASVVAA